MQKRGISPLIATVLLVGFTVALSAVVITWGTKFISETQEDVTVQTETGLTCADVNFDVTSTDCTGGNLVITVKSNSKQDVSGFILRAIEGTDIEVDDDPAIPVDGLGGFGAATITWDDLLTINPDTVEVIPKVGLGEEQKTCSAGKVDVNVDCAGGPLPGCNTNGECDDSNICTDDLCANDVCENNQNTATCDDGFSCTTVDTCSGGSCPIGTPDDNLCAPFGICDPSDPDHQSDGCVPPLFVFVTSGTSDNGVYNGNLGGLIGADGKCDAIAEASGNSNLQNKNWVAWLSTDTMNAADRLTSQNRKFVTDAGAGSVLLIGNDRADIIDTVLANEIRDQNGVDVSTTTVWTGTTGTGIPTGIDCADWTSLGADTGTVGNTNNFGGSQWTNANTAPCSTNKRLYCFEQP